MMGESQDPLHLNYSDFEERLQKYSISKAISTFADFNLERDAPEMLMESSWVPENEKKNLMAAISSRIRKFSSAQRVSSISRYQEKKNKRKSHTYIRYQIRQDLAGQRVRHKGKFVKNKRMNLKLAAEALLRGLVIRSRIKGADGQNEHPLDMFPFEIILLHRKKFPKSILNFP